MSKALPKTQRGQDSAVKAAKPARLVEQDPLTQIPQSSGAPPNKVLSPAHVSALQKTVGNRAVQRMVAQGAQNDMVQRHTSPEDAQTLFGSSADVIGNASMLSVLGFQLGSLSGELVQDGLQITSAAGSAQSYECPQAGSDAEERFVPPTGGI
jgi:hypothetical protein